MKGFTQGVALRYVKIAVLAAGLLSIAAPAWAFGIDDAVEEFAEEVAKALQRKGYAEAHMNNVSADYDHPTVIGAGTSGTGYVNYDWEIPLRGKRVTGTGEQTVAFMVTNAAFLHVPAMWLVQYTNVDDVTVDGEESAHGKSRGPLGAFQRTARKGPGGVKRLQAVSQSQKRVASRAAKNATRISFAGSTRR